MYDYDQIVRLNGKRHRLQRTNRRIRPDTASEESEGGEASEESEGGEGGEAESEESEGESEESEGGEAHAGSFYEARYLQELDSLPPKRKRKRLSYVDR
jgi:hypothetical protein